ncbi:hypothetical protein LDO26_14325 [Luteimonas sp. BDR2-5]|uniref:hypothetical protein n=1 Tax=Proluteimonas luteida TaxID=2878685 RepID=UPI001E3F828B|nr:hypothetical protein [Luteimonas sp. BDR2-5]MCD9029371.1 hypothetical protein [Luteimonas sp. BDR2-5]
MPHLLTTSVLSTLSAAGLGLLMWTGMTIALLHMRAASASSLHQLQLLALLLGAALVAAGLFARGPGSARLRGAAARWRTDWPARAALLATATLLLALLLAALLALAPAGASRATGLSLLGLLLLASAFATAAATATALSRAAPAVAAWQHPMTLPIRVLLAMACGLAVLYLLMQLLFVSYNDGVTMLATLTGLGVAAAACAAVQWRAADRGAQAATATDPGRRARTRHLRLAAVSLLAVAPLLAWSAAAMQLLPAWLLLGFAAAALLAGAGIERGLLLRHGKLEPAPA